MTDEHDPGDLATNRPRRPYGLRLATTDDVLALLDGGVPAAAVAASLELGLYWRLEPRPLATNEVAVALGIAAGRCGRWLTLLAALGLLVHRRGAWSPSRFSRRHIVGTYSQATWAMLARESIERSRAVGDATDALRRGLDPVSTPTYVERMAADPARARDFTRMLWEVHQRLAQRLAVAIDLSGVRRVLDLGGGSGVVAAALARSGADLQVTVFDLPSVCEATRQIVLEEALDGRVDTIAGDFLADELPSGFDLVLECDVGVYAEALFRRIRSILRPRGRFVIVDEFAPDAGVDAFARLVWAFHGALRDPDRAPPTVGGVEAMLDAAGFERTASLPLPPVPGVGGLIADDLLVIEARPR